MNPLDPLELQSFNERLMDIMPQQTETNLKIPQVMYGNMPKNLGELKNERFEKTLNKYQHIIEEILHRDKNNAYGEWFKQYSKKYFIESIGHDSNSFFKNTILADLSDIRQIGRQHNNPKISFGKLIGSTLETTGSTNATASIGSNELDLQSATGGVINSYYDEIAATIHTSAGNIHLGTYDDSSGANNLLSDSGSIACPASSSYTFQSVTEFQIDTTTVWLAILGNNISLVLDSNNTVNKNFKTFTFGALPNPAGTGYSSISNAVRMKIGHT